VFHAPTDATTDIHTHDTPTPTREPVQTTDTSSALSASDTHGNRVQVPEDDLCKICFIEPQNALFLPCAHLVSCASCAVLILTNNVPFANTGHGEINGQELIGRARHSLGERTGQLGYAGLRDITQSWLVDHRAVCPICRASVKRWIKVYRS